MGKVSLDINGRKYAMGCEDGEEERLLRLGQKLDDRVNQMANQFGQIGDLRLLVMAGITMMDEVEDTMQNIDLRVDAKAAGLRKERDAATLASAKTQAEAAKTLHAAARRIEKLAAKLSD
ncbi:cell division protein ZapA [Litorimonas sp. WD9-15]|uniref:cell division protein ZapA n=1 Tax=Litorimonas sp. WD9-15 TaxID=3418716 RepID=UPI003D07677A